MQSDLSSHSSGLLSFLLGARRVRTLSLVRSTAVAETAAQVIATTLSSCSIEVVPLWMSLAGVSNMPLRAEFHGIERFSAVSFSQGNISWYRSLKAQVVQLHCLVRTIPAL